MLLLNNAVCSVADIEEMGDLLKLSPNGIKGNRIGIVSISGGAGVWP